MKQPYIDVHGTSLPGERHEKNHDHFAIADLGKSVRFHQTNLDWGDDERLDSRSQGHVFLVADGLETADRPARASGTAVKSVVRYFLDEMPWSHLMDGDSEEVEAALEDALHNAQSELLLRSERDGGGSMGATLTLAFVTWPDLFIAHVGHGRAYLRRGETLRQLTSDHTMAEVTRRGGRRRPSTAGVLWNALGGRSRGLHPEVVHMRLREGDVLTLISDGVLEKDHPLRQRAEVVGDASPPPPSVATLQLERRRAPGAGVGNGFDVIVVGEAHPPG